MKVLHLGEGEPSGTIVPLQDAVTVISTSAAPERGRRVLDTLGRLRTGAVDGVVGEIEVHGLRFPLTSETLALLDVTGGEPAIVVAEDLPGHRADLAAARADRAAAEARRAAAERDLLERRAELEAAVAARDAAITALEAIERGEGPARDLLASARAARTRTEVELASARTACAETEALLADAVAARDEAVEAKLVAEERLERARSERSEAVTRAAAAAVALEEARSVLGSDPTERLALAEQHLTTAEEAAALADPDGDGSPVTRRLVELERRRAELTRWREAMGESDAELVAAALDRLLSADTEPAPLPTALALADTWRDLHQQIFALDAGVPEEERIAEERVAQARRTVAETQSELNQPVLSPEQIAKVEAAHTAVLEAQDRTEGRFGGARARKKLESLRADERRVLERLGFSTYADYMMSTSISSVGPANRALLDTAKAHLAEAQAALDAIPGAADRARRRTELLQRREAVAPRIAELLGHEPTGPEAEDQLRQVREPVAPDQAALEALAEDLTQVGITTGPGPWDREDLVLLARSYLAEQEAGAARRRELAEAIDQLDRGIEQVRDARRRGEEDLPAELVPIPELALTGASGAAGDDDPAATVREARWAEVERARAELAAARQAAETHREAAGEIDRLEAELATARAYEEKAAGGVANAEADLALVDGAPLEDAGRAVTSAEAALARARTRVDELESKLAAAEADPALDELRTRTEGERDAASARLEQAAAAEQEVVEQLSAITAAHTEAAAAEQLALAALAETDRAALIEDLSWALLTRLAAQRSVGLAGSLPLVLDDPLGALHDDEVPGVLDRLAGLAGAVQVVIVSDRPAVTAWAEAQDPERCGLLTLS